MFDEEVQDEKRSFMSHSGPLNTEPRRLRNEFGVRLGAEKGKC